MKSKKGKKAKRVQFVTYILTGISMAILGAVTSLAVTKSIALERVTPVAPPAIQTPAVQTPTIPTPPVATPSVDATPKKTDEPSLTEALAKITHIEPIYSKHTTSYRTCRWEWRPVVVHYHRAMDGSGIFLGGVTGGIVGNQFGGGTGKIAATIGGSVLGALAGNQVERGMNRPEVQYIPVRVCKRHYETKSILKGYNVTYSYNDQEKTTFMKKKPQSDYIKLVLSPVI